MFIEIDLDIGGCTIINADCIQRVYTKVNFEEKCYDKSGNEFTPDRLFIVLTNGEVLTSTFYLRENKETESLTSLSAFNELVDLLKPKSIGDMED